MKPKVYLAGKYTDMDLIHEKILQVKALGYEVVHDWTTVEQTDRSMEAFSRYAKYDIDAVKHCDIVIFVMDDPEYAYRGTFTEMGAALALDIEAYVIDPPNITQAYCATNVFFHHPDLIHFATWEECCQRLESIAKG